MKRYLVFLITSIGLLAIGCSVVDQQKISEADSIGATRSMAQLCTGDCAVTIDDILNYIEWKSVGYDASVTADGTRKDYQFKSEDTEIIPFPNEDEPSVYILNYPNNRWEILSTDKRTTPVLAYGEGKFSMDMDNSNLVGCIKGLADEIAFLHSYSGDIKNAEEQFNGWNEIIRSGKAIKQFKIECPGIFYGKDIVKPATKLTRASAGPDTSYHPVPGYYERLTSFGDFVLTEQRSHLTSTQWGENDPFNQYCPINPDVPGLRAPAGSEAVAGGQMVYFLHYDGDACPEVYNSAYCNTIISNNPDWTAMGQFNKSESNWAAFRTSDSTRMAAVLLANIGQKMSMNYGSSYSCGDIGDLQQALLDEYDLESTALPFSGGETNPYNEIYSMLQAGKPSIVHSGYGPDNTMPYTFIVDGYKTGRRNIVGFYRFTPYDMTNHFEYIFYTPVFIVSSVNETYFCMNWGKNGMNNEAWVVNSGDWYIASGDHSNRVALLSFRSDGSEAGR